jgi:2-polyprenyl-3-methyl-5-hydroxy-6-metoxy-1,4-benzoquinol methylase
MNDYDKYFEANKKLWNKRVEIHYNSEFYSKENFLKSKISLNSIELEDLGDVNGKNILHLQCHFGQDTLSLANLGADVTGVDFSDEAIDKAKQLSDESNIKANFICSNIYDLKDKLEDKFDVVFTSYGTIGWLPDIKKWAEIVSHYLRPGGKFLIVEFHPYIWMFDDNIENLKHPYFHTNKPIAEISEGTYTDSNADIKMIEYGWNHTLSDVTNSLISNGLTVKSFNEFNYSPYNCFPNMIESEKNKYVFEKFGNILPLIYSISAIK